MSIEIQSLVNDGIIVFAKHHSDEWIDKAVYTMANNLTRMFPEYNFIVANEVKRGTVDTDIPGIEELEGYIRGSEVDFFDVGAHKVSDGFVIINIRRSKNGSRSNTNTCHTSGAIYTVVNSGVSR